jgi:transcription initiation factor TFIIH subunit 1
MFTSKAGAKNTSAKLNFMDDRPKGGLTFRFTASTPQDLSERQEFQDFLIPIIAENKQRNTTNLAADATVAQGLGAGAAALTSDQPSERSTPSASTSRATTPAPVVRPNPSGATYNKEEVALRLRVLAKNPTLKALHRDLVLAKLVSDAEFWDGRQVRFAFRVDTPPNHQLRVSLAYSI